ncbi:Hypothetical predicted protein, partial [Lynx pardinus]
MMAAPWAMALGQQQPPASIRDGGTTPESKTRATKGECASRVRHCLDTLPNASHRAAGGRGCCLRAGFGSEATFQLVQNNTPGKDKPVSAAASGFLFLLLMLPLQADMLLCRETGGKSYPHSRPATSGHQSEHGCSGFLFPRPAPNREQKCSQVHDPTFIGPSSSPHPPTLTQTGP